MIRLTRKNHLIPNQVSKLRRSVWSQVIWSVFGFLITYQLNLCLFSELSFLFYLRFFNSRVDILSNYLVISNKIYISVLEHKNDFRYLVLWTLVVKCKSGFKRQYRGNEKTNRSFVRCNKLHWPRISKTLLEFRAVLR